MPVDVSSGGRISFFLRFGDGDNGGENADPGEDVALEYSLDGGDIWITLNTYDTEDYTNWTRITEDVPDAAISSATRFRWRQVDFDGSTVAKGLDNWSLDRVAPQSLDKIYIWNHQSSDRSDNPGYDVTRFDLTLFDANDSILLTLDDVALQPDTKTAQTFSFGQAVVDVSRVRFDIEDVQSSPTFTGLAEVGFNIA